MTIHIYQAQLLHYLTESDIVARVERLATHDVDNTSHTKILGVDKGVTLQPVIAGVTVYPEYIADGALVVDDVTGCVVDY